MKRKPFRPSASLPQNVLPNQIRSGLIKADALIQNKKWEEARELLEDLNRQYPGRDEILTELLNLGFDQGDMRLYLEACLPLARLRPNDSTLAMSLAGAYMNNHFVFLAQRAFQKVLERWPNHERAEEMREILCEYEKVLPQFLDEMKLAGEQRWEIAQLHEEAQMQLQLGHYAEARRIAQKVLEFKPDFTAAWNNISLTYSAEGLLEKALAVAERVLVIAPENVHALSNTIRFLCMTGQKEQAWMFADRLKQSNAKGYEKYLKIVEALSYLGDDAGIVAAYRQAEKEGKNDASRDTPFLLHLVAVAMQRSGREKEAQQLWKQALKIDPNYLLALENLEDLKNPVEERQGAWPFMMAHWVLEPMKQEVRRLSNLKQNDRVVFQNAVKKHPEFLKVVPSLLERGDPAGREFAFYSAESAGTPEMLEALRGFAQGKWGPDQLRLKAANLIKKAGLIDADTMPMWLEGEWREAFMTDYEVYEESEHKHSEQVADWIREAIGLIRTGDVTRAEVLLQQALDAEPNSPDILNNIALVYSKQGRNQEATDLIRLIYQGYPDYLFGRTNLAHILLHEQKIEEARALIDPLLKLKRLHFSEFSALAMLQVEVLIAENKIDAAEIWVGMWRQIYPEDRMLEEGKRRLALAQLKSKLGGLFRRKQGKKKS